MSSQKPAKSPLLILKKGEALQTVSTKNSITSLLSSHDGTEIIHQILKSGARWGMSPDDDHINLLESVYILSGKMKLHTTKEETLLVPGDIIAGQPVSEHLVLTAVEDSEFLYTSSRPVFHHYFSDTKELELLAIDIEKKDGYTAEHCTRIKHLSMLVGESMGLNSVSLQKLHFGAILHDIGKIKVPESILLKPGKLTEEEWKVMKNHTQFGADILLKTNIPHLILASEVVAQHHERYDGSGYPKGLEKEQICLEAAIVGLVDSYDAITSDRVYQKGRTKDSAISEIKQLRAIKYHPDVVDTFLSILESN
ncbi:HD domain-containing phosphohydrolase [Salipaludibacillus daqingensis]|uniref:HD domain-containing phosphohydrolase n=1 Tax=Salipaludibacillus daqingensis TaxID=3041001 RepID=UPI002474D721|nr:HD domain-containing phosphohydrolase [Salipaludibacillus daqingensis]